MRELRVRPDLDQLRRQARELLRGAQADEHDAIERFERVAAPTTLAGAQLVIARELGFPSWPRLRAAVEHARGEPARFTLRRVADVGELHVLWKELWAILGHVPPPHRDHWHVFDDVEPRRPLLLVIEHDGRIIGGAIETRLIGVEAWAQRVGLGTRLVQTIEAESLARGAERFHWHADPHNKGFFLRLGYTDAGKSKRHMYKGAPAGSRLRARRVELWRARAGDLEAGVPLAVDPTTGKVPGLPW